MNRARWRAVAKWVWTALILAFIAVYAATRWDVVVAAWSLLTWAHAAFALAAIAVAKLCLTATMRVAARRGGITLTFWQSFRLYNLSQLAKYLPGSVWQFVSRAAMLRERGAGAREIRDSMIAEHVWVLGFAAVLGSLLVLVTAPADVRAALGSVASSDRFVVIAAVVGAVVAIALWAFRRSLASVWRWALRLRPTPSVFAYLLVGWSLMGTSLWVIMVPFDGGGPLPYVIGLYGVAYVAGFVVPFAPAGIGVREAVLVGGISPFVGNDVAIVVAATNRLMYLAVELVLGLVAVAKRAERDAPPTTPDASAEPAPATSAARR